MKWFNRFFKKKQRVIWSELQIALYERQIAAAEAIGEKWCLHPSRRVESLRAPGASRKALRLVK